MGHKVHPTGFRIGVIKSWQGKWYADRHYATYLEEDLNIRQAVSTKYPEAAISSVEIERQANQVIATIYTARPGIVIGRGGQRVDEARVYLEKIIGKRIQLNIKEVQQPELDARLVAHSIAEQLERRIAYRRAMKQAISRTMQAGGKGVKVTVSGRLGGAEIARSLSMHEGRVPLHTLRADIDYGFSEARTVMGRIGVKAWIYRGDILPEAKTEEPETPEAAVEPVVVVPEEEVTVPTAKETNIQITEEKLKAITSEVEPVEEKPDTGEKHEEVVVEVAPLAEKAKVERKTKAVAEAKPEEPKTTTARKTRVTTRTKSSETKATTARRSKAATKTKEETPDSESVETEVKPTRTRKKVVRKATQTTEASKDETAAESEEENVTT